MSQIDSNSQLLKEFIKQFPVTKHEKGEVLFKPGYKVTDVYYLEDGLIRQYIVRRTGQEMTIHIFKPGAMVLLMSWLVEENPDKLWLQSLNEVQIRKIPVKELSAWMDDHPGIWKLIAKNFAEGILGLTKRVEVSLSRNAYEQVVSLLVYLVGRMGGARRATIRNRL